MDELERLEEPKVKILGNGSKYGGKPLVNDRVGRVYRSEKKYSNYKTHVGKGKTLRNKRVYDVKRLQFRLLGF